MCTAASSIIRADITDNVFVKEAFTIGDAFNKAIGFPINSPLDTTQSSAFLNTPGIPCAYSGQEI